MPELSPVPVAGYSLNCMKPILALVPALFSLSVLAADPAGFQLSVTVDRP
jgi:hypothetical protein